MIPNQHTDKCCGRIPPVAFPGVIFFAAAVLIFLSSCASSPDARRTFSCFSGDSIAADIAWEELGPGFSYTEFTVAGRGAVCRCVRLDLDTPGTQAGCIPDIKEPAFRTFSPRQLEAEARRRNFSVALNTNPFEIRKTGGKKLPIPVGIIRSDGNEISAAADRYASLGFRRNQDGKLRAEIYRSQHGNTAPTECGGFFVILKDGIPEKFAESRRSRSAAGLSDGGRILFIFSAVSGGILDRKGLSYMECAQIMRSLGAEDAIQFDGGRSSVICIKGKGTFSAPAARKIPAFLWLRTGEAAESSE